MISVPCDPIAVRSMQMFHKSTPFEIDDVAKTCTYVDRENGYRTPVYHTNKPSSAFNKNLNGSITFGSISSFERIDFPLLCKECYHLMVHQRVLCRQV